MFRKNLKQRIFLVCKILFLRLRTLFISKVKNEITIFPKTNYPLSFKPFLLMQGVAVFAVVLFSFFTLGNFFIPKSQVAESQIIKDITIKQNSLIVAKGQPIKWVVLVNRNQIKQGQSLVQIPKNAQNIKIKTVSTTQANQVLAQQFFNDITLEQRKQLATNTVLLKPKTILAKLTTFLFADLEQAASEAVLNIAETISSSSENQDIIQAPEANYVNLSELRGPTPQEEVPETVENEFVGISYETLAPQIIEQVTDIGKLVTVSDLNSLSDGLEQVRLTDVLAFTNIPEIFKVGDESKIKIKWQNNGNQEMEFHAYDLNENGKLDYVEWTVPHLSEQTFEIIYISKAFRLDQDKNIIEDIYDTVKTGQP